MKYVRLGKTGTQVSRLCLGCMSYGTPGWHIHPWVMDEAASKPFFKQALDAGINFFDTADYYSSGASESITGKALLGYVKRQDVVLATKVCLPMNDRPNQKGLSRKHIMEGIDASLKRLGTDYVDLYQIHRFDYETPLEETLEALNDVVRAGKALYIGASSMWAWQFMKALGMQRANGWAPFVSMQNFYNLVYREEEREMMPLCVSEGIGIIPWSPMARGYLTKQSDDDVQTSRADTDKSREGYFGTGADKAARQEVRKLAVELGIKPAQVALAWVLSKPFVTAPIIGATKQHHIDDAVGALDIELNEAAIARLESVYQPRAPQGHR